MTLKTVLRNFLNSVEATEARRQTGEDLFEIEFQKLKELTEQLKHNPDYVVNEGELEVNRRKNRYKDILPYDKSRVVVSEYPGVPGSDYVNANYIKGASGSFAYIASQGPLPNTVADFWRMIWEAEVQVIVMACNERESGKYKCECYWPNEEGEKERQYGNITVELVKWRQVCPDFLVRTLKYRCLGEEERSLCQFHYTTWPDHGVPTTVQPILDMVRLMRDCQASEAVPILIHCSAGCGRTGTICAIDYVWSLMRLGKLTEDFNLYDIIADMRRQRIAMVQTKEQYILVHRAVGALFEQQLRVIDNHTYENLDGDGHPLMLKELQEQQPSEHIYEDVSTLMLKERQLVETENPYSTIEETLSYSTNESRESSLEPPNTKANVKRRNSQILQKLCREESVKRLISGWNKAVSDKPESSAKTESAGVNNSESTLKPDKSTEDLATEHNNFTNTNQVTTRQPDVAKLSVSSSDKSPPSEKLVGKATVIRRPSIAKLKALFEKSHTGSSENNNNNNLNNETVSNENQVTEDDRSSKRVRPLGRSHSHHVPRGRLSPNQDNSESEVRRSVERERSVRRIVSPLARDTTSRSKTKVSESKNQPYSLTNSNSNDKICDAQPESSSPNVNINTNFEEKQGTQNRSKFSCVEIKGDKKGSWYGEHDSQKNSSSTKWYGEADSNAKEDQEPTSVNSNESIVINQTDQSKEPPQLPIKKKSLFRYSDGKLSLNQPHSDFVNQIPPEYKTQNCDTKDMNIGVKNDFGNEIYGQLSVIDVSKQQQMSQENLKEKDYVNMSSVNTNTTDDIPPKLPEKKILGRNSSVKQKNQAPTKPEENSKDSKCSVSADDKSVGKCYLSLSQPVHENITIESSLKDTVAISHKNHPGRKGDTIADRYTNVNPVSQKNIAQIEKSIKHHPRGAIIDLTSRTSFVENPLGPSHSCGKYATVRCKMPNNSSDARNSLVFDMRRGFEPQTGGFMDEAQLAQLEKNKIQLENMINNTCDNSNASNVESTYGILHSPPPRSRRPHLTKSLVKSKSGSDLSPCGSAAIEISKFTDAADEKEISHDKEINKAVKELNTIGYLLDALATQTLKTPADNASTSPLETDSKTTTVCTGNSEKPVLPVKQRLAGKPTDINSTGRPVTERQSVSFPLSQVEVNQNDKANAIPVAGNDQKMSFSEPLKNNIHYVPDYEYIFPLQKSASAPHPGRMFTATMEQSHHQPIPPHILKDQPLCRYQPDLCDIVSAPPKPPRTFTHVPQHSQLDGGRLMVSVASPKSVTKADDLPHQSKHFNYDNLVTSTNSSLTHPVSNPHASVIYPDISYNYTKDPNSKVNNMHLSQPSSPFHNQVPQTPYSGGNHMPHPSSYRTYPSYPEIHSVRAVPSHIPNSNQSHVSNRIRQSSSLGYGIHHQHLSKGPPPTTTFRRTQPDGLLTPIVNNTTTTQLSHQLVGHRPNVSNWFYDERNSGTSNSSATPDYGEIPVAPVYTMIRPDQDRHRVQWDSSVDEQQQVKGAKTVTNYENIYDVPKDCWTSTSQPTFMVPQGHELRHSQSDAGVYAAIRTHVPSQKQKVVESVNVNNAIPASNAIPPIMTQSASAALNSPLYSQVMKPKKGKNDVVESCNNTVVPRKSRRSRDDMDIQPVAPPRSKRQLQLRRSVAGGLCESGYGVDGDSTWHSDSEDEPPPAVPEKTKGAYITIDPEEVKSDNEQIGNQ